MPSEVSAVREQVVAVTITGEGAFIDSERIEPPDENADLQDVVLDAVTHRFAEPSGQSVRVIAWDGHALMTFLLRPNGTTSEIVPVYVGDRLAQAYAFRTIGIPRPEPRPGFFARMWRNLARPRPAADAKPVDLQKAAALQVPEPRVTAEEATEADSAGEVPAEAAVVDAAGDESAAAPAEVPDDQPDELPDEESDDFTDELPDDSTEVAAGPATEAPDDAAADSPVEGPAAVDVPGDVPVDVPIDAPIDDEFSWAAFAKSLDTPYGVFSEPELPDFAKLPDLPTPMTAEDAVIAAFGAPSAEPEVEIEPEPDVDVDVEPEATSTAEPELELEVAPILDVEPVSEPEPVTVAALSTEDDSEDDTADETADDAAEEKEDDETADDAEAALVPITVVPVVDDVSRRRRGALVAVLAVVLVGLLSAGAWALTTVRDDTVADGDTPENSPSAASSTPVSQAPAVVTPAPVPVRLTTQVRGGRGRVDALVTMPGRAAAVVNFVITSTDPAGRRHFLRRTVRLQGGDPIRVSLDDVAPGDWEWWVRGELVATAHGQVTVLDTKQPPESTPTPESTAVSGPTSEPTNVPAPTSEPTTSSQPASGPTGPIDPASPSGSPTGPVPGG
ncbi:MAG TPA: hypothetical protein VGJ41_03740 [Nocardioides sp.]